MRLLYGNFAPHGKQVNPRTTEMTFRTERRVPRLGVMLVGWGGNNGTTVTAAVLANKLGLTWRTKTGVQVSGVTNRQCISCWFTFIAVGREFIPDGWTIISPTLIISLAMFILGINYLKQLFAN